MWIIVTGYRSYVRELITGWEKISWREGATRFETRQEAKDFMIKHRIEGSAIPY